MGLAGLWRSPGGQENRRVEAKILFSLKALVHQAVLAPATSARSDGNRQLDGQRHQG